jgi:hypothetical protein
MQELVETNSQNEKREQNIKLFKAGDFIARYYRRVHPAPPTKA